MSKTKEKRTGKQNKGLGTFLDLISPSGLKFGEHKFVMGEQYVQVLTVVDFPENVEEAWLSRVANLPGVVCSMHIEPTSSIELLDHLKVTMGELQGKLLSGGNPYTQMMVEKKFEHAKEMVKKITDEQQNIFQVTVVLAVTAPDEITLKNRVKSVQQTLSGVQMRTRSAVFRQKDGFQTVGPWVNLVDSIRQMGGRNMPAETVAAAFPFTASNLNDGRGILIGTDRFSSIVLLDIWKREGSRTNSNMLITGRPGVGKSTTVKVILLNEYGQGKKVIYIDPEREGRDICNYVKGNWVNCGGGKGGRINPLQVKIVPLDDEEDEEDRLYPDELVQRGPLALHFQTLRTFFQLYLPEITNKELARLEIALEEVYESFGITWNTDPATIPNEKWPNMKDLYLHLEKKAEAEPQKWEDLALYLRSAAIGSDAALWAGHTTITGESLFTVLDMKNLMEGSERVKTAQYFNILTWVWNEISLNRMEEILLAMDEGYLIADPRAPQALQYVRNISKRIRKYSGALLFITHNFEDLLNEAVRLYGQALIDNPTYKVIMPQGEKDIQLLTPLLNLSESEIELLEKGNRGDALLIAGNRRLYVKIEPTDEELEIFGTAGGR